MKKTILSAGTLFILGSTFLHAAQWPDLLKPAASIGGGEKDAAVIMSVENYAFVAPVPGARSNATAWYDYLNKTRGIPYDKIYFNADSDVTAEDMKRFAGKAASAVGEGGTLWYVFIGHGAPSADGKQGLLVGVDAQQKAESINSRSLPQNDLISTLLASKAGSIVFLMDACFSGRSIDGTPLIEGLQPLGIVASGIPQDARLMAFMAAGGKEFAGQLPGTGRPAFSYLTLGGLRGWADANADGKVTAEELRNYTDGIMRTMVKDRTQTPQLQGDGARSLVKSAGEKGPDLAELSKDLAGKKTTPFEFKISALPKVPTASAPTTNGVSVPQAQMPKDLFTQGGTDFGSVDVDALEKYDAAITFEKSDAAPLAKSQAWLTLDGSFPAYAEIARKRASEWYKYAQDSAIAKAIEFEGTSAPPEDKAAKWADIVGKYQDRNEEPRKRELAWRKYASELTDIANAKKERRALMVKDYSKLKRLFALSVVTVEDKQRFAVAFSDAYGKSFKDNPFIVGLMPYFPKGYLTVPDSEMAIPGKVYIPQESFLMGSTKGWEVDEEPRHAVNLDAYFIDRYEVTVAQYKDFVKATGHEMRMQPNWSTDSHPIANVNWRDADAYCKWADSRLPTEAEWEKAARGGTDTRFSFGDDESKLGEYAWNKANADTQTNPVGLKKPNQYGIYDMYGNVQEWVSDWYDDDYYKNSPKENPLGPNYGVVRCTRGGGGYYTSDMRTANRGKLMPGLVANTLGFRCVISAN